MSELTHFDNSGQAHMVDVGDKSETHRIARAAGRIRMLPATLTLIQQGDAKKGDVLGIARIAAIQASKRTSDLIPLCHPLLVGSIFVNFTIGDDNVEVEAQVEAHRFRGRALGSGVVIDRQWVLTSAHVVAAYQPGSYAGPITLFITVGEDPEIAHVAALSPVRRRPDRQPEADPADGGG